MNDYQASMIKAALPITGRAPGPFAAGPGGSCVCPSCGTTIPKTRGIPCTDVECPKCGTAMVRDFGGKSAAYEEQLPIIKSALPITGRAPGPFAAGPGGSCKCPSCGTTIPKTRGIPCTDVECPKCGTAMVRDFGDKSAALSESAMRKEAFRRGFRKGLSEVGISDVGFILGLEKKAGEAEPSSGGLRNDLTMRGFSTATNALAQGVLGIQGFMLEQLGDLWPVLVFGAPALAGMLGGAVHSKIGSPTTLDIEAQRQKERLGVLKNLTNEANYRKKIRGGQ